MYDFSQLTKDIYNGREIEFAMDNTDYAITYTMEGRQISRNDKLLVDKTGDIDKFMDILTNSDIIDGHSMKDVFDAQLYNRGSLYIL
jgi:hypothetical protein